MTTDASMQLGMIGLGRMGSSLVKRLVADGHRCVVYDVDAEAVARSVGQDVVGASTLQELVGGLERPRVLWIMVPAGLVQSTVDELAELLDAGDIVVDGGNSYYRDDIARAAQLAEKGIHHVDCGTSGGVWGVDRGFCLMIGGEPGPVAHLNPLFRTIAPGEASAHPTPGRTGSAGTAPQGYLHCGPSGAGHFVKMVHNGIEYGMMAAIAEGLNIIAHAGMGRHVPAASDAETTPLRDPAAYQYDIDVGEVAEVWRRGSVIGSWLMDLTADALARAPALDGFAGHVSDSGEGRWTVMAAVETGVPAAVITSAVYERFASRGEGDFADKVLSAMRSEFGGHAEKAD
ncbi:decarboxylating 6-phosphogluconate dehydrogenase [Baekduia soli]|uniref:Decarboxylating 6-phosphogluconate dehydrogenase n=2 Tax=Baekduia soli TaxID=496014 RepID=A0A5B8U599_9ACTN|nr:decarboxylating 6-phosphogluconate dehydrogenase [Baekduia soli]